ncbi:MAG: sporulation integral membrane protein YtvI [Firmicutes bacterium]|nr:sporulation integral membrane protein YtvI [Bacillota bacterium]
MPFLPENGYKRVLVIAAYAAIAFASGVIFFRYLLVPLLPFIAAWCAATFLRPMIYWLHRKTKLPVKVLGTFLALLFISSAVCGLFLICSFAVSELKELTDDAGNSAESVIGEIFDFVENLGDKLPLLNNLGDGEAVTRLREAVSSLAKAGIASLSASIPGKAFEFVSGLPDILLFLLVLIIAAVYMCAGLGTFNSFITSLFPQSVTSKLKALRDRVFDVTGRYIRAYTLILLMTFAELSAGLLIIGVEHAIVIAAVIAAVDILPIIGAGSILVPWALIALIRGDGRLCAGLFIIYIVISIIRQLTEPKIIGKSLGLPPIITLMAAYAGYEVMGFAGLLAAPLCVLLIRESARSAPKISGSGS